MAAEAQIARSIKRYLCTELATDCREDTLGDEDSLLDSGILDSFGIMALLKFIEREYGVSIPAEDIEPEKFESVAAIARTVQARLGA
jgi:acyl carrier protein